MVLYRLVHETQKIDLDFLLLLSGDKRPTIQWKSRVVGYGVHYEPFCPEKNQFNLAHLLKIIWASSLAVRALAYCAEGHGSGLT